MDIAHPSADPRLAAQPLMHRGVAGPALMREIFVAQLDLDRRTLAGLARWNDIGKEMPRVVAAGLLAAGRDDRGTADRHVLAVELAPVAIDRIGEGGMRDADQDAECAGKCEQVFGHEGLLRHQGSSGGMVAAWVPP